MEMWSRVLLATGVMLTMSAGVASIILVKKLGLRTTNSLNVLATSEAVISTLIGVMLIVLGSTAFDDTSRSALLECTRSVIVSRTAAFVVPFVSSFMSMLLTAVECWMVIKEQEVNVRKGEFRFMRQKKRLATTLAAQWSIPIVSLAILLLLVNEKAPPQLKSLVSNETCADVEMAPIPMTLECSSEFKSQLKIEEANNITATIVERIYQLLHSTTAFKDSENVDIFLPSHEQNEESWKTLNEHYIKVKDKAERTKSVKISKHELNSNSLDESQCSQQCTLNSAAAKIYVTGVIISTYVIPLVGTMALHFSTRANMNTLSAMLKSTATDEKFQGIHCSFQHVKNTALPTFLMWTPIFLERLLSKWFCRSAPQWVEELLFILGQISTALRGALSVKLTKQTGSKVSNMIHPMEPASDQQIVKELATEQTI